MILRNAAYAIWAVWGLSAVVPAVRAKDVPKAQADHFENKVRPLLVAKCFSCHSTESKKSKGGLVVDSLSGLLDGGDTGPAIVPGDPAKSLLLEAVRQTGDLKMPPKEKLSDAEVAVLTEWVKSGTPWPNAKLKAGRSNSKITDDDRAWWAFRPVKRVDPPKAGDGWARNNVDRFVAARWDGLKPAPEASRTVLIRRLSFDLVGLPPTPAEMRAFVDDPAPDAYERLVDRLLASRAYGERWARHWLDLVRYADSDGYRLDEYRPTAWRYRDYVIASFNADKSYARFVREQIAGDELFHGDADALVATGYLRHGIYEYNNRDARTQWQTILNDITDTTADVFLGLGLQCARCHDHKFDPLLQKDYYRLQAFFAGLMPRDDLTTASPAERSDHASKMKAWEDATAKLRAEIGAIEANYHKSAGDGAIAKFPADIQAMIRKPVAQRSTHEHQLAELAYRQVTYEHERIEKALKGTDKERVLALRRDLAKHDALKPPPLPMAFAATDVGKTAAPTIIPKRGDADVPPGFPTILDEQAATVTPLANSTGRRSALAMWLTRDDNPLTARVLVNRVWQQHFGRGLAANASDFGRLGDAPTHPELLDWLAATFVADGWSVKTLHRRIVTSATYRQSATHPDAGAGNLADPENKRLWRGSVRRLDAEQIRDALLSVTGEMVDKPGGAGVPAKEPRRSIYTQVLRNNRDPLLEVFDAPLAFTSASGRDTTTTPVQSLLLFNSPQVLRKSRVFADRLAREAKDDAARVDLAYRLTFGRPPTAAEISAALAFVTEQAKTIDPLRDGSPAAAFVAGKMPYRDGQAADVALNRVGFEVPAAEMPTGDFTVEAFIQPRTIADTGAVRTVAAKWDGDVKRPGWGLGISGKQSRRKPQTVVIQLVGTKADGKVAEEAIFSDHHIRLDKPHYIAVAVRLATKDQPGSVTFFVKDLSNDDEPLLTAKVAHAIVGGIDNKIPMTIGKRGGKSEGGFDGLVDDVRLSSAALGVEQLLFTREGTTSHTVGYWQFEAKPDVFRDASGHGRDIRPMAAPLSKPRDVRQAAWADFCHVLLNSSEFLYVE